MPLIQVRTNITKEKLTRDVHLKFSARAAELMNKPEARVSVTVECGLDMCRGGSFEPVIEVHIAAIGVDCREKTQSVVAGLSELLHEQLGLPLERIVFKFSNLQPFEVGVNGNTM
ncbi:unnamed protein product [Meganyctiphanes norvegica]|uniref:D-dopachrome decarboxylase n=1 Tax=Meganyctiphanes norvegica TaxID=48144 RepID=A0AAV2RJ35_MEGNR